MQSDLASRTGVDHTRLRSGSFRAGGAMTFSSFSLLSDVGCEAVPWMPEETGACAGRHKHLPPEDPQHCLWGPLLPPDVWGSSWICQEDGGWLHVWLCSVFGSSLWLCSVRQCVIEVIFLVCSHQNESAGIQILIWSPDREEPIPKCFQTPWIT